MMQRGYIILIAGGTLLAIGIAVSAVWGVQLASIFVQDNTFVNAISMEPGRSVETTRQITDTSSPLTVAVHIQAAEKAAAAADANTDTDADPNANTGPALRDDIRLLETVKDPFGAIVNRNEFSGNLLTTFTPEQSGNYILTITNIGTEPVMIDGTFGYMPFIGSMATGGQGAGTLDSYQE